RSSGAAGFGRVRCQCVEGVEVCVVEAGPGAGVAGGTGLVHQEQDGIAVAVEPGLADALDVARGVSLAPVLLTGTRPVRGPTARERSAQRLCVEPGEHEDLAGVPL